MTELYPQQRAALRKLANGKVLWGGTGSGKTPVAAIYYQENEAPRDVYVITTARKRDSFDWQQQFYELGIGPATGPVRIPGDSKAVRAGKHLLEQGQGDGGSSPVSGSRAAGNHLMVGFLESDYEVSERWTAGKYPYVLTVDSWNNIAKYANVAGAFFIFDEQRLVGSGDWVRKFLRIAKHNRWILLSATPGDTWMDYVPLFIANGFYKNRTEFKREHVVYNTFTKFPKIDRYINVGKLAKFRSQLLVEMVVERHTRRRHVEVMLEFDKKMLDAVLTDRWHVYEDRPLNDVGEMFMVARKVVNSDPSRLGMVKELWKNHPKLIVFYNFNYELMALRTLSLVTMSTHTGSSETEKVSSKSPTHQSISRLNDCGNKTSIEELKNGSGLILPFASTNRQSNDGLIIPSSSIKQSGTTSIKFSMKDSQLSASTLAEWNGHKHQPVPTTEQWIYLVQYQAGAEAWNCVTTDAMILYSQNYSWKIMEQGYGRTDRLNTPFTDLWYYGFTSDSFIDRAIARSLRAKETFNEAKYKRMFAG